ncbi:MAG: hypothetical protein DRI90_13115 [Deltaproteobacteria bacterium]|nr:MAG: hypothetical protein DRI90_13115 [Deltaproteobacteria bacterium]
MRLSQRPGLFAGVALVTGATIILQIALTRLYSALLGHHLAFLAISLSLFGVGLGGVLLYVIPALARPPRLFARLALLSGAMALSAAFAMHHLVQSKPIVKLDLSVLGQLSATYLITSLPFVFSGLVVAAAIRFATSDISRLYLIDLVGAAAGGLAAVAALRVGAPRAGLIVAVIAALAGIIFAIAGRDRKGPFGREQRPPSLVVPALVLITSVGLLGWDRAAPWLQIRELRWVKMERVELMRWNEMALITVDKPVRGVAWMRMDASAATAILAPERKLPLHPDEMAYVLHGGQGPVLVIGAGGGRDVLAALRAGQKDIYAAEINPLIVNEVMLDKYYEFSGRLFARPEMHVHVADGRSFVRSHVRKYRNIVISLVDTWAASSVGALSLSENSLYTVEAYRDFIEHLEPEGTLLVNRWDREFERLLALSVAGLRAAGAHQPADHLFACGHKRSTSILLKATPLTDRDIHKLRRHCKRHRFYEVFAPDRASTKLRGRIARAVDVRQVAPNYPTDLSPPTDDRPFFFHTVPLRRLVEVLGDWKLMRSQHQGLLTLVGLLLVSTVVGVVFLLGPLLVRRVPILGAPDRFERLRALAFFLCLGGGFVFVELALVQQLVMFLGHPVYALSTVLVALLLTTGIGSLLTAKLDGPRARGAAAWRAQLLVALLLGYAVGLGPALDHLVSLPFVVRLALIVLMITPLGLLMGSQMPLGIKLVARRAEELVPWCWGLNGAASVVATALATLVALHIGFAALLWAGAAVYLAASVAVPRAPRRSIRPSES